MGDSDHTDVFRSSSCHPQLTFHSGLCGVCRWDWAHWVFALKPWHNQWELLNCIQLFATPRLYAPWNSPGQNTRVGSLSLLQGIFPTQGSNPGLPHCRWILYQLSYKGNPRILEWVAYPFSRWSFWPRNWTGVSCIAEGFFTNWAIREALAQLASKLFLISGNCIVHRDEMLWHSLVLFLYFASSSHLFPLLELFAKLQIP